MSNAPSTTQDDRGSQSAKRRKRKERTGKVRTPEPKDIVSGAGQPLDPSVRRDLEEQLGHDLGQVRLHTDRDAGHLTELLGADAVAVGQDIFFRENTYRPGTTEGQRLLAHELLHTVQNPHGLGTLRAGRDLGAVSLPQQAVEREAEDTAQELVRGGQPETRVEPPQSATPGWLRYATVDADRNRMEKLDPATLVDRLANSVVRSLRGDPEDRSKRTRMQLARMSPGLRESVLDRLEVRLLSNEHNRLLDLVDEADRLPLELQPANVPAPVPDAIELVEEERTAAHQAAEGEREAEEKRTQDSREEKRDQADERSRNPKTLQERRAADAAEEKKEAKEDRARRDARARQQGQFEQEQRETEEKQAEEREKTDQAAEEQAQNQQEGVEQQKEERKEQREREEADPQQANAPGADKRKREDDEKKPADGSKPEDVDPKAKGQPGPVRPEKVDERADQRDSALSEHGLNEKDEDEDEPREEERPLGLEAGADKEIGGEADDEKAGAGGAGGEPALKPEDYLPSTDLDVSSVPTADQITPGGAQPALPTFPTPPPTKAEQIEEERENDAESEENEEEPEAEAKPPGAEQGPVEGEAPQPEGGPAADAADRTEKDLQPEQPVDQEVGPDPDTEDRSAPEPEAEEKKDPAQQQEEAEGGDQDSGNDGEQPDAKEAQAEQQERKDRDEQAEKEESKGQPQGAAADKPATAATAAAPASASATPPAGAHTETTPTQDRTPSPAARRAADSAKGERDAPVPKSQILKEQGPGAAPSGAVGGSEPAAAPSAAAGPGGAPSAAQAAVSPVGEQADSPGRMGAPAPEGAKATPEASLEKDGGGCAPPEPASEQDGAGGSCGGGGGGQQSSEDKKQPPPDVSGQDPKTALNTVSQLPPDQAQAALPGVDGAAAKKVSDEQRRLDANPPTRERPSGAPQTQSAPPESQPAENAVSGKVEEVTPEDMAAKQRAKDVDKAEGEKPAQGTQAPSVTSSPDGKADAQDAKNIEQAADSVPTTDPALNRTVGPAPKIRLEGESDPKRTDQQAEKLKEKQAEIQETGRADTTKNLGEDRIYPNAPRERLRGKAPGGSRGGGGGAGADAGQTPDEGVAVVTKQERGPQIQAGATAAHGQMVAKEKEQQQGEQQAKQQKQAEIDQEVARNAQQQTGERGRAAEEAQRQRADWRKEQDQKLEDADKETEQEHRGKNDEINKEKDKQDKEIGKKKDEDNQKIDDERERAEKEAARKKEEEKKKKEGGGGFLGWVKDQINNLIDAIVSVVTAVFDAARKVVNGIIEGFKTFVNKAIDFARDFAIKAIKALADVLIKIGDVLLAAFPELRDKFRKAIENLRDKAIAAVNRLADGLKKAVNALLDALAAGLNKLLDALEAGIKAAIEVYRKALLSAIEFAQKALALLGQFAALAKDIAPDPGGWLSKAGSAAKTGISEHLWGAIKVAVKEWFNAKVEGILGLGKTIINVLVKGCVSLKQIGKMAWDAVVASLPVMIATIIIEKLVSMIIPAAGAILTIIQGLMAAWQTISRIIAAFGKFFAYLKAVKAGPAACLFAEAVAAGVVALLDFITNFLLARLGRAVKGVGNRLKAMAQKIMQGLKKTAKGARKAAGSAVNRARGAVRKAEQALTKPATPTTPKGPRVPSRPGATTSPGGTRRPLPTRPTSRTPDRPPSRTPDRRKERNRNEAEAQRERDREKQTTPPKTPDRRPDAHGGGKDRTPDKPQDKTPDTPKKKPKEVEAPKRTKPRKPKSPLGRALTKVKGAVKSALKKVRNAGKALGRKLRKSKVGKALKNSARRVRDFFKKKRDLMRGRKKQRIDQKKQRRNDHKKKENSRQSKEDRLKKIVSRIQPILRRLLALGVPRPVLQGLLRGLRLWYRLTGLELTENGDTFGFLATLNPSLEFDSEYWDQFSRVGSDAIRRFNENATQTRSFTTQEQNRNAERYGQAVMGHHMSELPRDERRAALEYSDFGPVYNDLLRANEDPKDMLEMLRIQSGWRDTLQRIMGPSGSGRHGHYTPDDLQARINDPTLDPFDRNILLGIMNAGLPGDTPEQLQSRQRREIARRMRPLPSSRREQIALSFGEVVGRRPGPVSRIPRFPTPEDVLNRSVLIDEATRRNRLTEGIEVHRTLGSISFMRDENSPDDPDPSDLIGREQREHGFMSTSVGGESTFPGLPYHLRISVPEGSPALWIGRTSRYPHQRELLLPSNTLYVIKGVMPATGKGPWIILAEVL
ncbi:DUF4157 domain-containing protein [Streptomyces sp. 5-6(2022)]|uniref:eCIS core domain-containing protein n=1 Tax=Streptomyces sp. 5-6(2022) TaxID=2936510 RepID=UPI0023B9852E|nr:DUF4157 domain-containing protein [Streptomyces sp. 5-6(2022)]